MSFKAYVQDNFILDGIDIFIVMDSGRSRYLLRPDGSMEEVQEHVVVDGCTIRLNNEAARALLDKLTEHYQGASDLHTVRSDLLHEREQRDKLTDAITRIAEAKTHGHAHSDPGH
jgi:hypothetical protein